MIPRQKGEPLDRFDTFGNGDPDKRLWRLNAHYWPTARDVEDFTARGITAATVQLAHGMGYGGLGPFLPLPCYRPRPRHRGPYQRRDKGR